MSSDRVDETDGYLDRGPSSPSSPTKRLSFFSLSSDFRWQLITCMVVIANEAIAATLPLPFVGLFVSFISGVSVDDAGYSSGLLITTYFVGQMLSGPIWGRAGDRFGRRSMMLCGLAVSSVVTLSFGFCYSLWMAIAVRFFQGAVNGNMILAKTMVADITDSSTEHIGFSAISLFWGIGSVFGPLIGGLLYDPSRQRVWSAFQWSTDGLLGRFPALLPSAVLSVSCAVSFVWVFWQLKETSTKPVEKLTSLLNIWTPMVHEGDTGAWNLLLGTSETTDKQIPLESLRKQSHHSVPPATENAAAFVVETADSENHNTKTPYSSAPSLQGLTVFQAFCNQDSKWCLLLYMCISAAENGMMEILPLWAIAQTNVGGLNYSSSTIGTIFMWSSMACIIANIFFDRVAAAIPDNMMLWDLSIALWIGTQVIQPLASQLPPDSAYLLVSLMSCVREVGLSWAFSMSFMATARCAPKHQVGTLTGIAQSAGSLARMVFLLVLPPCFAWSLDSGLGYPFNHHFAFLLVSLPLVFTLVLSRRVPFLVTG